MGMSERSSWDKFLITDLSWQLIDRPWFHGINRPIQYSRDFISNILDIKVATHHCYPRNTFSCIHNSPTNCYKHSISRNLYVVVTHVNRYHKQWFHSIGDLHEDRFKRFQILSDICHVCRTGLVEPWSETNSVGNSVRPLFLPVCTW